MSTSSTRKTEIVIEGLPATAPAKATAVCTARLTWAVEELLKEGKLDGVGLWIGTPGAERPDVASGEASAQGTSQRDDEFDVATRAGQYAATDPVWGLERLVAPDELLEELHTAIQLLTLEPLVFDTWGLRAIEPFPRSVLNFHGLPGTGKTMAAHGVAASLGKKIIVASYAQIESKYHGDGPKNVEALFHAARRDKAVLFIDEADSLLSRRLTNVTQGSEQAINSMRSQLLICLEQHRGVAIFATNLVENYDPAFETRVRHIHFPLPDESARAAIWRHHLPPELPLARDVVPAKLATASVGCCGREIKNAVVNTALRVALSGREEICHSDFVTEIRKIAAARSVVRGERAVPQVPADEERAEIEAKLRVA